MEQNVIIGELLEKTQKETMQIIEQMKDTVSRELNSRDQAYIVYSGICKRDEIGTLQDGLYLVVPQERTRRTLDLSVVRKATENGLSMVIDELFLMRDDISHLEGKLVTNYREFQVRFRLQRKLEYEKEILKLKEQFYKNRVSFQPLYTPYFYRFFYVVLEPVVIEWKPDEVLEKVEVDKTPLEEKYEEDMIPVWNLSRDLVHNRGERIFVKDGIYLHYEFRTEDESDDILVDYGDRMVRHLGIQKDGTLVIETSEQNATDAWTMIHLRKIQESSVISREYPLVSNRTSDKFLGRFAGYFGTPVLSTAELKRKINSYEDMDCVEFIDAEIVDGMVDYDTFLIPGSQNYGMEGHRPYLVLRFRMTGVREWMARETISFLAAAVGQEFLAYQVVGILVDRQ